jgi:hypothetical protein
MTGDFSGRIEVAAYRGGHDDRGGRDVFVGSLTPGRGA